MQTFLPYQDFEKSVRCLDYRRLGRQRTEAATIHKALSANLLKGWQRHPAVMMWVGYNNALADYYNHCIDEWVRRGYNNTLEKIILSETTTDADPPWLGVEQIHASHRSNLLRKDPEYYGKFGWKESPDLPYTWPSLNTDGSISLRQGDGRNRREPVDKRVL